MKTTNVWNTIDSLLRTSALTVVALKEQSITVRGELLYQTCMQQVTELREKLEQQQYDKKTVDGVSYAVSALLDEIVLRRSSIEHSQGYQEWQNVPLQVTFFKSNDAGTELYEKIRAELKQNQPNILLLSCYQRVLHLGFQGSYLGQAQEKRNELIADIEHILQKLVPFTDTAIVDSLPKEVESQRHKWLFFCTITAVIGVVITYFSLKYLLAEQLLQLFPNN